jgi:hypothetical protein
VCRPQFLPTIFKLRAHSIYFCQYYLLFIIIHDRRVCSEGILCCRLDGRVCKIKHDRRASKDGFLHCGHDVVVPEVKKIGLADTTIYGSNLMWNEHVRHGEFGFR